MKYKPYPKYKDSGIKWLGEIPEDWGSSKVKYECFLKARIGWQNLRSEEFSDIGVLCFTGTDFESGRVNTSTAYRVSEERYCQDENIHVINGDILITKDGTIGKIALVENLNEKATLNSGVFVTRSRNGSYVAKFLFWYLSSNIFSNFIEEISHGSTIVHLYQNDFVNFPIPLPRLSTQRTIAAFLDSEIVRIDGLIKDYEELIELLKEKRQALISHAVTRGLSELVNPDDPEFGEWAKPVMFKDSGVEWIGEIPEGWETWQLKRDLDIVTSGSRGWAEFYSEEGSIFIRIGNLTRDGITLNLEDIQRVEAPDNAEAIRTKVCESDLLVSITADIGSVAVIENLSDTVYISQHLAICRLSRTTRILPHWAAHYLKSYSGRTQFDQKAYGGTKIQLSLDDVRELLITIPLKSEQQAIVSFLDKETSKIDTLVSESESAIELLKEHRSALITNAVTGKINVENIA